MKLPNVPVVSGTILSALVLLLFVSGRYESLIPQLRSPTEGEALLLDENPSLSTRNTSKLPDLPSSPAEHLTCVVYERPPRTGSTTIGEALERCLLHLGYKQPVWKGFQARSMVISDMLQQPYERVMAVTRHFYMNGTALRQLRNRCESLLYITSTATMKQRLWSLVKYRQLQTHGNTSLSKEQVQLAIEELKREKAQIKILNSYPYLYSNGTAVDVEGDERIVPDYVIRKSMLVDDVSDLLHAFGCSSRVISQNVHRARHDEVLDAIDIDDNDSLHTRLLQRAEERNEFGLKKASNFGR
ncbi:unnamed protein product [Agarophyton chilense]|eukprot:gb/GEZJ01004384.1/.p1 GENE.gb/GEZJ01004384.1/~~gb/GEZJ01004384.1/.p1  ORF type:complete len:300 (-),score=35.48 gb/GEZJ01004384.1/:468-1367(-)